LSGDMSPEGPYLNKAYVRVPLNRIGVVIGEKGKTKEEIENTTGTIITVDSRNGSVVIEPASRETDPISIMKARDIIRAIAIGFPPEKALRLAEEDQVLVTIDLKETLGSPNHIKRVKGRIIGEGGKTRKIIEETTGCDVHIGEHVIGIIGDYEQTNIAREAIGMLIEGKPHAVVYSFLERMSRRLKRKRMTSLWK
jgi:ribosomal RNA assembly protein